MRFIVLFFFLTPLVVNAQSFKRKSFDYDKLSKDYFNKCDESATQKLSEALQLIDENNSTQAVALSKDLYDKIKDCHLIYEVYGYSLFRNGDRLNGIKVLDEGIDKLGSVPELIKRKSEMSIELGELGPVQKHIDGSSVYQGGGTKFDEKQFKNENYRSALRDLKFLYKEYGRNEEQYLSALIYKNIGQYKKSNTTLESLRNDSTYGAMSIFNMADNYISLKQADKALKELQYLESKLPREPQILSKIKEVYKLQKDSIHEKEYGQKAFFYKVSPSFLDLKFNPENYSLIKFFISDTPANDKLNRLNKIYKKEELNYTIDVCLIILKLHANHGNPLEERASEILGKIGKPALHKMQELFTSNIATCSVTNLGFAMAETKDDDSWKLMVDYLKAIKRMPRTLIPPNIPAVLLKYDEERGLTEILKEIKTTIRSKKPDNALSSFGHYIYYISLDKIDKNKIKKEAKRLAFTDKEIADTMTKIFEK